jgi:hypothetical protein
MVHLAARRRLNAGCNRFDLSERKESQCPEPVDGRLTSVLVPGCGMRRGSSPTRSPPSTPLWSNPHQVVLAAPGKGIPAPDAAAIQLERIIVDRFGDRDVLVATKDGQVVQHFSCALWASIWPPVALLSSHPTPSDAN